MDERTLTGLGEELLTATRSAEAVPPLGTRYPSLTTDDAYRIQSVQLARWRERGRRVVGRKVGLTSAAMQEQLGIDSPDSGYVLDHMVYSDGDVVPVGRFIAPRIEPELAFVLGRPLRGPVTLEEAAEAVDYVFTAFEIIDSRIDGWDIGLVDTIADNASCGAVVLGREPLEVGALSTRDVAVTVRHNGTAVESGRGEAVLGDPIRPLAWLAETLGGLGEGLEAGDFVLTGSFCRAVPVVGGDRFDADYGEHGVLTVSFTEANGASA